MKDFLNVFLDDILDLPLDMKIEFEINIVPVVILISKAPYRIALAELKELKKQLQNC